MNMKQNYSSQTNRVSSNNVILPESLDQVSTTSVLKKLVQITDPNNFKHKGGARDIHHKASHSSQVTQKLMSLYGAQAMITAVSQNQHNQQSPHNSSRHTLTTDQPMQDPQIQLPYQAYMRLRNEQAHSVQDGGEERGPNMTQSQRSTILNTMMQKRPIPDMLICTVPPLPTPVTQQQQRKQLRQQSKNMKNQSQMNSGSTITASESIDQNNLDMAPVSQLIFSDKTPMVDKTTLAQAKQMKSQSQRKHQKQSSNAQQHYSTKGATNSTTSTRGHPPLAETRTYQGAGTSYHQRKRSVGTSYKMVGNHVAKQLKHLNGAANDKLHPYVSQEAASLMKNKLTMKRINTNSSGANRIDHLSSSDNIHVYKHQKLAEIQLNGSQQRRNSILRNNQQALLKTGGTITETTMTVGESAKRRNKALKQVLVNLQDDVSDTEQMPNRLISFDDRVANDDAAIYEPVEDEDIIAMASPKVVLQKEEDEIIGGRFGGDVLVDHNQTNKLYNDFA